MRYNIKNLDKIWADEIKKKDINCAICKSSKCLNVHHILPKHGYKEYRHNILNGITLCVSCHKFGKNAVHKNSLFFSKWLRDNRPEQYNYLMEKLKS